MRRPRIRKAREEIEHEYPIADRYPGWWFRVVEISAGAYVVDGCDLYGRSVSRNGSAPEALLDQCVADAQAIQALVNAELHEPADHPSADDLAGMTINERLLALGLLEIFDEAVRKRDPDQLRKLLEKTGIGDENIEAIVRSQLP